MNTVGFHQKYSDIKTPAGVSILKRAVLNQAQFVMSQIQENNCSPNEPFVVVLEKVFLKNEVSPFEWTLRL